MPFSVAHLGAQITLNPEATVSSVRLSLRGSCICYALMFALSGEVPL